MGPIRTRIFALDALTPRERGLFLDRADELTRESIARLKEEIAASHEAGRRWDGIGTTGALREIEASSAGSPRSGAGR